MAVTDSYCLHLMVKTSGYSHAHATLCNVYKPVLVHLSSSCLVNTSFTHKQELFYDGKVGCNVPTGCLSVPMEIMLPHHTIEGFTPV